MTNTYIEYEFRSECASDAQTIRAVLFPWLMDWKETRVNLTQESVRYAMPDVVVELSIAVDGPNLDELRWLIDGIDNCHVAAETVQTRKNYTGEREGQRSSKGLGTQPSKDVLSHAIEAVKRRQEVLRLELERAQQLYKTYEAGAWLGISMKRSSQDAPNPGSVIVVEHEKSGLVSVRAVKAPRNCKKWQSRGDACISARMSMLGA